MSKKVLMLFGTIIGNCGTLALCNLWPDIPTDAVQWAIAGISSAGIGGVLGQGFADGVSRGLTSHRSKMILENQRQKNKIMPGGKEE